MSKKSQALVLKRQLSKSFSASDSDVTFRSIDGVLFKLHKKNLDLNAGAFPPAEFHTSPDEVVALPETSETLEVVFKFLYVQRRPKLAQEIEFELLDSVAEAAEKYQVFVAMDACEFRMRNTLPEHADRIILYAVKHGYNDIVDLAAIPLLDHPFEEVLNKMPNNLIRPWAIYYHKWAAVQQQACSWHAIYNAERPSSRCTASSCDALIQKMVGAMSVVASLELLAKVKTHFHWSWVEDVKSLTKNIAPFSSFLE